MHRMLHWTPRVLAVGFALFLALFALDVFGAFDTVGETAIALFMHLIPTFILLAAAAIAWRWQLAGGLVFLALGVVSVFFFHTYEHIVTFLTVSVPAFIVGVLFLWDRWQNRERLTAQPH